MKKTKMEKGITLMALIITIVILLILAIVAINSITNDGIISYTINVTKDYNQAIEKEQGILGTYENFLNNISSGNGESDGSDSEIIWTQNKTSVTNGEVTLEVGDYVDYKAGVNGYTDTNGWKVLGAENGQLLLISTSIVATGVTLSRPGDYLNDTGINKLNTACEPYGKGTYATGARSVNVDDINRVTGYNPETAKYGAGESYEYGNEVTYTLTESGYVSYSGTNGASGTSEFTSFTMPDGTTLTKDNSITLKNNYYFYYPNTLTTSDSGTTNGISTDSEAYKTIFLKPDGTTEDSYYLASQAEWRIKWKCSLGTISGVLGIRKQIHSLVDVRQWRRNLGSTYI